MLTEIYRYELPDGGGPFFTKDGSNRVYKDIKFEDDTLSGCANIAALEEWFHVRSIPTDNFLIKKYCGEMLYQSASGEIILKKSAAKQLTFDEIML